MPRDKPRRYTPERPKVVFQRVLSEGPRGIRAWGRGPRFMILCAAAAMAGKFMEGVKACRGPGGAALRVDELPACIVQCSRGWSALPLAAEKLREDDGMVGRARGAAQPPCRRSGWSGMTPGLAI